jgi:hypothetical protein
MSISLTMVGSAVGENLPCGGSWPDGIVRQREAAPGVDGHIRPQEEAADQRPSSADDHSEMQGEQTPARR